MKERLSPSKISDKTPNKDTLLELKNINKYFDENHVLKDLSFEVKRGEFLTLLGPSGCGKTTTLRIIAGLEIPNSGQVILDGEDITSLPPNKRNVNTVFQNYALFPHMTVYKNVAYGPKTAKLDKAVIKAKTDKALAIVQMSEYANRKPDQLSGGQRQRIAIARAIANEPELLLLDEPLGALDLQLRRQMQVELKKIQKELGITFVYITHDQEEALNMSDRVAIMNEGQFEQIGTPDDIYENPESVFAAKFIGDTNILIGSFEGLDEAGYAKVNVCGHMVKARATTEFSPGEKVYLSLRSERVRYAKQSGRDFYIKGKLTEKSYVSGTRRTEISLEHNHQIVHSTGFKSSDSIGVGEEVCLYWNPDHVILIKEKNQTI